MPVQYVSTRGEAPSLDFGDALLAGLATDGGLYCPEEVPEIDLISADGSPLTAESSYADIALAVMWPFVEGSIDRESFVTMVEDTYRVFRHPDVVPLVDLGHGIHLLDLSRGPTLAFKDVALQLVGHLLDHELTKRGERVTVLAATSGDTGSAAIEALKNRKNVSIVVLHPYGRVSDVQRRQMTTVVADNVRNVAVDGDFDDCQDLVKAAFNDPALRSEFGLAAVNSINWARVMAQVVYYVSSTLRLGAGPGLADTPPVSFTVPTGNFGNILAGWYAKRMGNPTGSLIVASNRNDVLTRFFETGSLTAHEVTPSLSPSMDIQVSSNFERLLWEASGRDGQAVAKLLADFRTEGDVAVPKDWVRFIRSEFESGRADDDETLAEIERTHTELGLLIDPHTAVALKVARKHQDDHNQPMVVLSTASPAKFPDAVHKATGVRPDLPPFLAELHDRTEYFERSAADLAMITEHLHSFGGS